MKSHKVAFTDFLERFPKIELPVTLTEAMISEFEKNTDPFTPAMISEFIPEHADENAEYVEYVPCFRIPDTHDFHAVIVWRGDLMKYHFLMMTYDKHGKMLASATIAGTESDGKSILRSVATIESDWIIHIVEGDHDLAGVEYQPLSSRAYRMELLPSGEVIFLLDASGNED